MTDSVSIYKLGIYGKAYDVPGTCRAYTYKHQPDNQGAWRLGEAMSIASKAGGGDCIDTGLGLLKQLGLKGYGVYELEEAGAPEVRQEAVPEENPEQRFEHYLQTAIDGAPEPLRRLGEYLGRVLDEDRWATAERMLNGAITAVAQQSGQVNRIPAGLYAELEALRTLRDSSLEREQIALAHAHDPMPVLDDDLRYILGRPNFWCYHLANALRAMGQEIARKAEEEQAAVIHWLLKAYFEHGPRWREAVEKILAAEREKELAKGDEQ